MGIPTLDAISTASGFSGTAKTWSHTCTGSNLILVVGTCCRSGSNTHITGITYNGVSLSKATSQNNGTTTGVEMWYLLNPSTGANNIIATYSNSTPASFGAASFTGAAQTGQPNAVGTNTSGTNTETVTVVPTVKALVIDCQGNNSNQTSTFGGSQTALLTVADSTNFASLGMSYEVASSSVGMVQSATGSLTWSGVGMAIVGLSANGNFLALM